AAQLNDAKLIKQCVEIHFEYLDKYTKAGNHRWLCEILESLVKVKRCKEYFNLEKIDPYFQLVVEHFQYDVINKRYWIETRIELYKIFGRNDLIPEAQEKIGLAYIELADVKKNDPLVAAGYLNDAAKYFTKINKQYGRDYTELIDRLKIRIKQVNKDSKSQMQSVSGETKIPVEAINEYVNRFKELTLTDSLGVIGSEFHVMIPHDIAVEKAKSSLADTPLLALVTETVLSDDNIIAEVKPGNEKLEKFAKDIIIHHCYSTIQIFINPVLQLLIKDKGLSCDKYIEFISDSNLIEKDRLSLIKVGIERYWAEDYISSMHILVFQIEGILRDVLGHLGRPTTKIARDVTQERLLDDILRDEILKHCLGDDFCYFLQIILSDPLGVNLRNRVGHALARENEFNKVVNLLLLLILLRFGVLRYSLPDKNNITESE
ncbi:MAG: DUF4209 domain-containing protein, partial [candidate division Zixibacteria bacterium]|nr:DUF4209 domain-containing protein [candidate division Zixibacteria bacterium]